MGIKDLHNNVLCLAAKSVRVGATNEARALPLYQGQLKFY